MNWHRLWLLCTLACGAITLAACSGESGTSGTSTHQKRASGWYLEKTSERTAQITWVDAKGQEQAWEGQLFDDSPKGTPLNPLQSGQDNGLFRWAHPGCATLSFVLTTDTELRCTTCMEPAQFVAYTPTCPLDQQRLPIQNWHPKGLLRPKKVG
ncbi:MAG: hypothetical protein RLZZ612_2547 [Pseudomonadota bacterium]|jgi:hypothetical protein